MKTYISTLLQQLKHHSLSKPTHSPHKHQIPSYGAKQQCAPNPDLSRVLSSTEQTRIQIIVGALLYYARAVDNKLLVALGSIATQTHLPTQMTQDSINQLLNYVSTYPNDGVIYRKSGMQLTAHSDAGYLNDPKDRICASNHIYLSKDVHMVYCLKLIFNLSLYKGATNNFV